MRNSPEVTAAREKVISDLEETIRRLNKDHAAAVAKSQHKLTIANESQAEYTRKSKEVDRELKSLDSDRKAWEHDKTAQATSLASGRAALDADKRNHQSIIDKIRQEEKERAEGNLKSDAERLEKQRLALTKRESDMEEEQASKIAKKEKEQDFLKVQLKQRHNSRLAAMENEQASRKAKIEAQGRTFEAAYMSEMEKIAEHQRDFELQLTKQHEKWRQQERDDGSRIAAEITNERANYKLWDRMSDAIAAIPMTQFRLDSELRQILWIGFRDQYMSTWQSNLSKRYPLLHQRLIEFYKSACDRKEADYRLLLTSVETDWREAITSLKSTGHSHRVFRRLLRGEFDMDNFDRTYALHDIALATQFRRQRQDATDRVSRLDRNLKFETRPEELRKLEAEREQAKKDFESAFRLLQDARDLGLYSAALSMKHGTPTNKKHFVAMRPTERIIEEASSAWHARRDESRNASWTRGKSARLRTEIVAQYREVSRDIKAHGDQLAVTLRRIDFIRSYLGKKQVTDDPEVDAQLDEIIEDIREGVEYRRRVGMERAKKTFSERKANRAPPPRAVNVTAKKNSAPAAGDIKKRTVLEQAANKAPPRRVADVPAKKSSAPAAGDIKKIYQATTDLRLRMKNPPDNYTAEERSEDEKSLQRLKRQQVEHDVLTRQAKLSKLPKSSPEAARMRSEIETLRTRHLSTAQDGEISMSSSRRTRMHRARAKRESIPSHEEAQNPSASSDQGSAKLTEQDSRTPQAASPSVQRTLKRKYPSMTLEPATSTTQDESPASPEEIRPAKASSESVSGSRVSNSGLSSYLFPPTASKQAVFMVRIPDEDTWRATAQAGNVDLRTLVALAGSRTDNTRHARHTGDDGLGVPDSSMSSNGVGVEAAAAEEGEDDGEYRPSDTESRDDPESDRAAESDQAEESDQAMESDAYQSPDSSSAITPGPELTYHITAEEYRKAAIASPKTGAGFWSFKMYKNAEGKTPKIHYCTTFEQTEEQARHFLNEPIVGFDLEWEMGTTPGKSSIQSCVSLVQIASEDRIGLFQLGMFKGETVDELLPPSLRAILESPKIAKAGVNVVGDANRVLSSLNVACKGLFELSHLYNVVAYAEGRETKPYRKQKRLAVQVEEILRLPLKKGDVRVSAWSKRLGTDQTEYAASDAYAGFQLYHALEARRKGLRPMPPRPAAYEEEKPLIFHDGSRVLVKPKSAVPRSKQTGKTAVVEDDVDEEEEEYFDAVESLDALSLDTSTTAGVPLAGLSVPSSDFNVVYPTLPTLDDLAEAGPSSLPAADLQPPLAPPAPEALATTESHQPALADPEPTPVPPASEPRKPTKPRQPPPPSRELALAESWVATWRASLPPEYNLRAGNSSLRAYHLWHQQGFDCLAVASLLRDPPLSVQTVANYVVQAVHDEDLPYDRRRLREAMDILPRVVHWRYQKILNHISE